MKFLTYIPHANTIYAGRSITQGYKNAILDKGFEWSLLTADTPDSSSFLFSYQPNIILMSLSRYVLKYLDIDAVKEIKKRGAKVFVSIPFWSSPLHRSRINETPGLSDNSALLDFIVKDRIGDVYYNVCEQGDPRMDGFEKFTGYKHYTIPLAADKVILKSIYDENFKADISYVGTNLSQKREYFKKMLFPLAQSYDLKLYGQDWTLQDKILGWIHRGGQYFNIPFLKNIQKPKLQLEDEAIIYKSSTVSINIHEDYQRKFGGDCNERTFKIPLCGGFEISDYVACITKYFEVGKEIVVAENKDDWFDKIDYYIKNPDRRIAIIEAGRSRVLQEHTYHKRVEAMLGIHKEL
jgi:spore maturation protein CgeB